MQLINKLKKLFLTKEFRNFLVGGITAFLVDFGLLTFQTYILNFKLELLGFVFIPNVISTTLALIYSFYFQKYISFKGNQEATKKQFPKFVFVSIFNLVLFGVIVFAIFLDLHIPIPITKLITTGMQMCSSFILYKFFVFKKI